MNYKKELVGILALTAILVFLVILLNFLSLPRENNEVVPIQTIDVSEPGSHKIIFSSGKKYLIQGEKIIIKLGQEFFAIYPDGGQAFNAKVITIIGKNASYNLSVDDGTCTYEGGVYGDIGYSAVSTCSIGIETKELVREDESPKQPASFDFTMPISSPIVHKEGSEFIYAFFEAANHRMNLLSNYGSYSASVEKCIAGQMLGPIVIGPQSIIVECLSDAAKLHITFDPNRIGESFQYKDFEPAERMYGWGNGRTNLELMPTSDSVCKNPMFFPPSGKPPTKACLDIISEQLIRCEKLSSDECFFDAAVRTQDLSLCERIKKLALDRSIDGNDEFNRQSCYYGVAQQKLDVNVCFKIDPLGPRGSDTLNPQNQCILKVAQYSKKQTLCDLMSSPERGMLENCRRYARP